MSSKETAASREERETCQALSLLLLRVRGNDKRSEGRGGVMRALALRLLELSTDGRIKREEDIVTRPVKQTFDALEHDRNEMAKILKRIRGNVGRDPKRREEMLRLGYRLHEMLSEEVLLGEDLATETQGKTPKGKARRTRAA